MGQPSGGTGLGQPETPRPASSSKETALAGWGLSHTLGLTWPGPIQSSRLSVGPPVQVTEPHQASVSSSVKGGHQWCVSEAVVRE